MVNYNLGLQVKLKSIIQESGYAFSDEDKTILIEILELLEKISKEERPDEGKSLIEYFSLVMKFLRFFGIENLSDLS